MKKWFILTVSMILVSTVGCGSGNMFEGQEGKLTTEAKKFATSAALDSGDYASVLSDPNANPTDYAAAAMGAAGLDPVKLIQTLNDVASGGGKQNDLSAVVSSIKIDTSALDELQTAKVKLTGALQNDPTNDDLKLQIALTSLTSTLTAVAQVGEKLGVTGLSDGISDTEAGNIGDQIGVATIANLATSLVDTTGTPIPLTEVVSEDVSNIITYGVGTEQNPGALPVTSDLRTVLNNSIQGTNGLDSDSDKKVTATEISNYYSNILGK